MLKQCLLSMLTFEEKPVMIKAKKSGVGKCSYTAHFLGMHLPVITARRIRLQACNREERYINVQVPPAAENFPLCTELCRLPPS